MNDQKIGVLLIEDNPGDARLIGHLLGDAREPRFHIECADRLDMGRDRLSRGGIDVLLLDLSLPDSRGLDTYMLAQRAAPSVPVVVLSGFDDTTVAVQAVREGAQDYLIKGHVDGALLARALRYAIERKRAQDEINRLNQHLEQRVMERTAELTAANNELEAFTYSVAHDLRAPLRHMNGFAELLREAWYEKLDEEGRRYVDKILKSSNEMGRLIDDLLNFAHLGRVEMHQAYVSLRQLVERVRHELESEARGRTVTWEIGPLPDVYGDPSLLHQVMMNLVANAVKYTRKCAEARIEIGSRNAEGGEVTVFVRDNGVGFNMQYAGKLFQVFQRLHRPQDFEGTGVGLANVRRIIERHGGRVWAEGSVGSGATFYFSLPVRR